MGIVPATFLGRITFYEAHIPVWSSAPSSIGLLAADCTALQTLITNARKAYDAQQAALNAAKGATTAMHNAVEAMTTLGAIDIAKIKNYADSTGNKDVYSKAEIPMPASPSPIGPPGTPTDFVVTLLQSGAVNLKWKCSNPAGATGTMYEVERKIGSGAFTLLGSEGSKSFTDVTLPAGGGGGLVTYQITAVRSTASGMPAQFNVNFGVGGDGMMFATVTNVTPGTQVRMAA